MVLTRRHARRWGAYVAFGIALLTAEAAKAEQTHSEPYAANQIGSEGAPHNGASKPSSPSPQQPAQLKGRNQSDAPQNGGSSGDNQLRITDVVQAISAALSMAATAALAIFAWRQIRIYQRQTRVMDLTFKASARASRAAAKSAKAAEDAVAKSDEILKHSREIAERDSETEYRRERPYLFAGVKLDSLAVGPYAYRIVCGLRNSGRTPAFLKKMTGLFFNVEPYEMHIAPFHGATWPLDFVYGASEEGNSPPFFSNMPTCYFCVAIEYEDIDKRSHFSRAVYRVNTALGTLEEGAILPIFANVYWNDWD